MRGTAMGSSVSVVVAEIVMLNIKEQALTTYEGTRPLWLATSTTLLQPYTKTQSTIFTNT